MEEDEPTKNRIRKRADHAKPFRCNTLCCVLEYPQCPENVATVIRNIDALGVGKLYIVTDKPNVFERTKTKKTAYLHDISASAMKYIYIRVFSSTNHCILHLQQKKYTSIVTSPHHISKTNWDLTSDFTCFPKLAIWFGNESKGISDEALSHAMGCLQIPMYGIIESLNLAVSTGIVLHAIATQRRLFKTQCL